MASPHDIDGKREPLLLFMDSGGGLADMLGHDVSRQDLKSLMRHPTGKDLPCLVTLVLADGVPADSPVVNTVIALLRENSNPQLETRVYVSANRIFHD